MDNQLGGRPNFFEPDDEPEPSGVNEELDDTIASDQPHPFPADPQPWPLPVDGADLLDEIQWVFKDHIVMGDHGYGACTLWVPHTYCYKLFTHTPRLFVHAPTHACGKSTALDLLAKLTNRPILTSDVTGAALVQLIDAWSPALLVDEHDSMSYADSLRNVYNSGFTRGGQTIRREGVFNTFAPFALASTTLIAPAMRSRSIVLHLVRKLPTETTKPVSEYDGTNLRRKIARWVQDNQADLAKAQPRFPRGITDRLADAWRPLLTIAEQAGGSWPKLARHAAVALSTRNEQPSEAEQLLSDIKEIFGADEALFSFEIVKRLLAKAGAPWAGEGLNEWVLAAKLAPFGIHPKKMRLGSEVKNGYRRDAFIETWQRWQIGGS
jgi:hypothetical protein